MKLNWFVTAVVGLVVAALGFAQVNAMRLEARLTGAGNDKGKAKWVVKDARGEMQAQWEVEAENLAPNETYLIYVDNNQPWSVEADNFGGFELHQLYRGPNRPSIGPGSSVLVTDVKGNSILLGALRAR